MNLDTKTIKCDRITLGIKLTLQNIEGVTLTYHLFISGFS